MTEGANEVEEGKQEKIMGVMGAKRRGEDKENYSKLEREEDLLKWRNSVGAWCHLLTYHLGKANYTVHLTLPS